MKFNPIKLTGRFYIIGKEIILGKKIEADDKPLNEKFHVGVRDISQVEIERCFPEDGVLKVFKTEDDARKYAEDEPNMIGRISATNPIFCVTIDPEALQGLKVKTEGLSDKTSTVSFYEMQTSAITKVLTVNIPEFACTSRGNYDPDLSTLNQMAAYPKAKLHFQFLGLKYIIDKKTYLGISQNKQPHEDLWKQSKGGAKEKTLAVLGQFKTSWCCMKQRFTNEAEGMLAKVKKKEVTDAELFPLAKKEMTDLVREGVLDDPYGAALSTIMDNTVEASRQFKK